MSATSNTDSTAKKSRIDRAKPTEDTPKAEATPSKDSESVKDSKPVKESTSETKSKTETPLSRTVRRSVSFFVIVALIHGVVAGGYFLRGYWLPHANQFWIAAQQRWNGGGDGAMAGHDGHEDHAGDGKHGDHDHAAHGCSGDAHGAEGEVTFLQLSEQGKKNIGLQLQEVQLQDFDRTITIPAMIKERLGRTKINVSSPMIGIVSRIYPIQGEAISPGMPLFELQLTHGDLVDTQSRFLETIEQLHVVEREVARLEKVTSSGVIAGKRLLERQYEQQQIKARLRAQQQAMALHGLTEQQIEQIKKTRELFRVMTVFAPRSRDQQNKETNQHFLQVSEILVSPGQYVQARDLLCILSDHAMLYIEGKGFEEDAEGLNLVANTGRPITAIIDTHGDKPHIVSDLRILYLENEIELASRALRFYVRLPNKIVREKRTKDGHLFIGWRFRPGQRVQLSMPVERWEKRIVVPITAVIHEGAEWFIFQQNGNRFDRKPVHVEYHDQRWAVIENDGVLFPGDVIVAAGAHDMHLEMKNKAGGAIDPHAGHNH